MGPRRRVCYLMLGELNVYPDCGGPLLQIPDNVIPASTFNVYIFGVLYSMCIYAEAYIHTICCFVSVRCLGQIHNFVTFSFFLSLFFN